LDRDERKNHEVPLLEEIPEEAKRWYESFTNPRCIFRSDYDELKDLNDSEIVGELNTNELVTNYYVLFAELGTLLKRLRVGDYISSDHIRELLDSNPDDRFAGYMLASLLFRNEFLTDYIGYLKDAEFFDRWCLSFGLQYFAIPIKGIRKYLNSLVSSTDIRQLKERYIDSLMMPDYGNKVDKVGIIKGYVARGIISGTMAIILSVSLVYESPYEIKPLIKQVNELLTSKNDRERELAVRSLVSLAALIFDEDDVRPSENIIKYLTSFAETTAPRTAGVIRECVGAYHENRDEDIASYELEIN
jgi:hypothetical protein